MKKEVLKRKRKERRHLHIRKMVFGTAERPRLAVWRSNQNIAVQVINDDEGVTLVSASSREKGEPLPGAGNAKGAAVVGERIAQRAIAAGITQVCFDRAGYKFHGRVKALAEAARKGGLKF